MATREEITTHHEPSTDYDPWIGGPPQPEPIAVVDYDERWPAEFERVARTLRAALGEAALAIEHVGSTSVRGLPAKPVLDIDLTVADPKDEAAYVPALSNAGFVLCIREPDWHEHRCFRSDDPRTNLHVFGPGCPEVIRHRMFRQWLLEHPEDRDLYRRAKLAAAAEISAKAAVITGYNKRKEPMIREIYARMFRAHGLL